MISADVLKISLRTDLTGHLPPTTCLFKASPLPIASVKRLGSMLGGVATAWRQYHWAVRYPDTVRTLNGSDVAYTAAPTMPTQFR